MHGWYTLGISACACRLRLSLPYNHYLSHPASPSSPLPSPCDCILHVVSPPRRRTGRTASMPRSRNMRRSKSTPRSPRSCPRLPLRRPPADVSKVRAADRERNPDFVFHPVSPSAYMYMHVSALLQSMSLYVAHPSPCMHACSLCPSVHWPATLDCRQCCCLH